MIELAAQEVALLVRCLDHLDRKPRLSMVSPESMRQEADEMESRLRDIEALRELLKRIGAFNQ